MARTATTTTLGGLLSALASAAFGVEHTYCDGPFNFPPFSSSTSHSNAPPPADSAATKTPQPPPADTTRVRNDYPRTSSAGFDPEALERGAKALREISSSSQAKKVIPFLFPFSTLSFYSLFFCNFVRFKVYAV